MEKGTFRITHGGDPKGGFLVDIHDGERNAVYSPEAKSLRAAVDSAVSQHVEKFPETEAAALVAMKAFDAEQDKAEAEAEAKEQAAGGDPAVLKDAVEGSASQMGASVDALQTSHPVPGILGDEAANMQNTSTQAASNEAGAGAADAKAST